MVSGGSQLSWKYALRSGANADFSSTCACISNRNQKSRVVEAGAPRSTRSAAGHRQGEVHLHDVATEYGSRMLLHDQHQSTGALGFWQRKLVPFCAAACNQRQTCPGSRIPIGFCICNTLLQDAPPSSQAPPCRASGCAARGGHDVDNVTPRLRRISPRLGSAQFVDDN